MKRNKYIIIAATVALTTGIYFSFFHHATTDAVSSALYTVTRADLEDVVTSLGKLEPATYVDVGAQVSG
jgi:multidrug efflux pump subunit AcrA (membrane-fusion protein)